jgi:hypothetical protein
MFDRVPFFAMIELQKRLTTRREHAQSSCEF